MGRETALAPNVKETHGRKFCLYKSLQIFVLFCIMPYNTEMNGGGEGGRKESLYWIPKCLCLKMYAFTVC